MPTLCRAVGGKGPIAPEQRVWNNIPLGLPRFSFFFSFALAHESWKNKACLRRSHKKKKSARWDILVVVGWGLEWWVIDVASKVVGWLQKDFVLWYLQPSGTTHRSFFEKCNLCLRFDGFFWSKERKKKAKRVKYIRSLTMPNGD